MNTNTKRNTNTKLNTNTAAWTTLVGGHLLSPLPPRPLPLAQRRCRYIAHSHTLTLHTKTKTNTKAYCTVQHHKYTYTCTETIQSFHCNVKEMNLQNWQFHLEKVEKSDESEKVNLNNAPMIWIQVSPLHLRSCFFIFLSLFFFFWLSFCYIVLNHPISVC